MKTSSLLACAWLLLLSGCHDDMDWFTVPGSSGFGVSRALWRNPDELWLQGPDRTLVRARSGEWTSFELCTGEGWTDSQFAFDRDGVVWGLCSKQGATRSYKLLRFANDRTAEEVAFPAAETSLFLIQTGDTLRFAGEQRLYAYDADGWRELGSQQLQALVGGIGEATDDFYVHGRSPDDELAAVWHGDGEVFEKTTLTETSTMTLRDGKLYSGTSRVLDGKLVAPAEAADTRGRNIRWSSPLGDGRFMHLSMPPTTAFEHAAIGGIWLETAADEDLKFLGHAPFDSGSLYGGGGLGFFYAVDDATVLVGVAGTNKQLVEGK